MTTQILTYPCLIQENLPCCWTCWAETNRDKINFRKCPALKPKEFSLTNSLALAFLHLHKLSCRKLRRPQFLWVVTSSSVNSDLKFWEYPNLHLAPVVRCSVPFQNQLHPIPFFPLPLVCNPPPLPLSIPMQYLLCHASHSYTLTNFWSHNAMPRAERLARLSSSSPPPHFPDLCIHLSKSNHDCSTSPK